MVATPCNSGLYYESRSPVFRIMFHLNLAATLSRLLGSIAQERPVLSYTIDSHCSPTRYRGFLTISSDKLSAVDRITRIFILNRFSLEECAALDGSIYYIFTVEGFENGLEGLFIRRRLT